MNSLHLIIHYHEIILKGKNRFIFVKKLIENLKEALGPLGVKNIRESQGRLIGDIPPEVNLTDLKIRTSRVFGMANFAIATATDTSLEEIQEEALRQLCKEEAFDTFRIYTKRAYKGYPLSSMEVDRIVGAYIKEKLGKQVNLTNPSKTLFIEILKNKAYIYTARFKGPGGLPVSTGGTLVSLLSGGIDSPVAAYRMMKRGCKIIFVHFHSYPYLSKTSQEKVQDIVEILSQYQGPSKLYLIPFGDIQKEIVLSVPHKYRIVLYRRMMMRIAGRIAMNERALALITGESLGQVSSQTLENITTIEQAAPLSIMRPLIGMDKQEIIDQAKAIGTYEISIIPDQDCCQLFIPRHPAVRTHMEEVKRVEASLPIEKLIEMGIKGSQILMIRAY